MPSFFSYESNSHLAKESVRAKGGPYTHGGMGLLKIYDDDDLHSLPSGVWDIKEPMTQAGWKVRIPSIRSAFRSIVSRTPHSLTD
jgi:hypothetical protein